MANLVYQNTPQGVNPSNAPAALTRDEVRIESLWKVYTEADDAPAQDILTCARRLFGYQCPELFNSFYDERAKDIDEAFEMDAARMEAARMVDDDEDEDEYKDLSFEEAIDRILSKTTKP
ncbi:MAG: hypothetical protein LBL72_10635 [Candidatus Accumulibacter sp.]|jgi:hypothetical protein|nr:hypothetical protein [Accumulibacter sp.]